MGLFRRQEKPSPKTQPDFRAAPESKIQAPEIQALLNDEDFKLKLASELHDSYCYRESQRQIREGKTPDSYLNEPLFTPQALEIYQSIAALPAKERKRIKAIDWHVISAAQNDIERDNLINDADAYRVYEQVLLARTKALAPFTALQEYLTACKDVSEMQEFLDRILESRMNPDLFNRICKALHATWMTADWMQGRDINDREYLAWENLSRTEKFKDWEQVMSLAEILKRTLGK